MATIVINGMEYTLARNLRVAYELQGQHSHKPYTQITGKSILHAVNNDSCH